MNKLEFENLSEIMKCRYPHICVSWADADIFRMSPALKKNFYPVRNMSYKRGIYIFNGYQTHVWVDAFFSGVESGHIRISTGTIKMNKTGSGSEGWMPTIFSFKEEGSPLTIYKTMKMKVFW